GSAGALLIGLLNGKAKWKDIVEGTKDALRTSVMILSLIAGATVFGRFMAVTRIPFLIAGWIEGLPFSPTAIMWVIIFMFFVLGFFMDAMAMVTLIVPVIYPVVVNLGFDPIWFGVIVVIVAEMGVITPPVGVNVFVIKGIAPDIPLEDIFRGIAPFLVALVILVAIVIAFPQVALWLPSLGGH